MQYKFITIPAVHPEQGEQELNSFLSTHRIISIDKTCCQAGQDVFWAFAISFQRDGQNRSERKRSSVDYKEVLNEEDFQMFAQLRELRNSMAREEGKPPYAIFTNEQLADMVRDKVTTQEGLAGINGIGKSRLARYANTFLPLLIKLHGQGRNEKTGR